MKKGARGRTLERSDRVARLHPGGAREAIVSRRCQTDAITLPCRIEPVAQLC